jgi:hypothetical protein
MTSMYGVTGKSREAEIHAPESSGSWTGGKARRVAVEQLPVLRVWRRWGGSDQRVEVVGGKDSEQDGVKSRLRVLEAPLLA